MKLPSKVSRCLGLCLAAFLLVGCPKPPPPPEIGHYISSPRSLRKIDRVVFIGLERDGVAPRVASDVTAALFQAIQAEKLFHLDIVPRSDPACRDLPLESREALTIEQLAGMREALRCDAVLFGSISRFQPHPQMQLGLYLRLLDLKDGRLVWAVEHIWDSTDKQTQCRMEEFFRTRMREYAPVGAHLGNMSPKAFAKFVAHEVAGTLRPPPCNQDGRKAAEGARHGEAPQESATKNTRPQVSR